MNYCHLKWIRADLFLLLLDLCWISRVWMKLFLHLWFHCSQQLLWEMCTHIQVMCVSIGEMGNQQSRHFLTSPLQFTLKWATVYSFCVCLCARACACPHPRAPLILGRFRERCFLSRCFSNNVSVRLPLLLTTAVTIQLIQTHAPL